MDVFFAALTDCNSFFESVMARYKGRPSAQTIVRDFPHVVEIRMAIGGLGKRIDAMHEFHSRRGIRARNGPHRHSNGRDFISWCFADSQTANTFAAEFGGNLLTQKSRRQ
jgi:hypothetical protein